MHLDYYSTFIFRAIMKRWRVMLKSGKTQRMFPIQSVGNLFSFCITIFVNEIPDVLLGLSLLVFSSHFENELSLDQEYFRVKIGVAAKSILLRRLEATSWLHRKEGCNYLSMSTFDQLSVPCGHLIEQQWYIC